MLRFLHDHVGGSGLPGEAHTISSAETAPPLACHPKRGSRPLAGSVRGKSPATALYRRTA